MLRALVILLLIISSRAEAADIVGDMRKTSLSSSDEFVGYFELGAELGWQDHGWVNEENGAYIQPAAGFELRFKGMFAEGVQGTSDGLNLGYTLMESASWSIDLLTFSGGVAIELEEEEKEGAEENQSEARKNRELRERERAFGGVGVRVSRYWGDYVIQFRLINDVFESAGVMSTLRVGRNYLYRNWNLHCIASLVYSSAKTNQHFIGVQAYEATERYPEFNAQDSTHGELEFGVTYPLSENWVFKGLSKIKQLPDSQRESPLVDKKLGATVTGSVTYVF